MFAGVYQWPKASNSLLIRYPVALRTIIGVLFIMMKLDLGTDVSCMCMCVCVCVCVCVFVWTSTRMDSSLSFLVERPRATCFAVVIERKRER